MSHNQSPSHRQWKFQLGTVGLTLALGAALLMGANSPPIGTAPAEVPPAVAAAHDLSAAFRYASGKVLPSVVTIRTESTVAENAPRSQRQSLPEGIPEEMQPFLRRFFGENFDQLPRQSPRMPQRQGMGSGVIIDPSGIILTNNHVVERGNKVIIRLHDGREFEAVDVKTDPKTDIAVVRIEADEPLPAGTLGNSDDIQIGDWVLAIGAPFGLDKTVTAGIISAKSRGVGIAEREEFLQTDAAINPGNSGGPLVNLHGEIIGINTAISSRSGGNEGIGFAVPINLAQWVGQQLAATGNVQRAFLGVGIQQVTSDLSKQFGLSAVTGAVVTDVRAGAAAEAAGVEPGDVIVEFDGRTIDSPRDLQNVIERATLNEPHKLVVIRDGKRVQLTVTLQRMPENLTVAQQSPKAGERSEASKLGIEVSPLSEDVAQQLGMKDTAGVVIVGVEPGSVGDGAGLQEGMVISRVGSKQIRSLDDFNLAVRDADLNQGVLLLIRTESGSRFVVVRAD